MSARAPFDDVLIVIPCLNEELHLGGLLDALTADTPGALIVVADGGSSDGSRAIVLDRAKRAENIRLVDNPARLQSAGVNLGARLFGRTRKWLVRIDAHCGYPAGYVSRLLSAAADNDATCVVVPMRTRGSNCFQRAAAAAQNSVLGTGGSSHRHVGAGRFVDHGHHALMRLDPFFKAGGYCERFVANEDAELDHRLTQLDARIWLEPSAAIDYYPRRKPAALFRQYLRYGTGRAMTVQRHRMAMKARQIAPTIVAPAVLIALLAPIAGWWLAVPALIWAIGCVSCGLLLGWRARDRCIAMTGGAAMIMHFAWALGFWRQKMLRRRVGPPPEPILVD